MGPIGNYTDFGTFINKVGDDLSLRIFDIKGVGEIFASGLGAAPPDVVFSNVIAGRTGQFTGAQGSADYNFHGYDLFFTITITSSSSLLA